MEKMLIANARILDPSCEPPVDFIGDILIEGDRIIKVGSNLAQTKIAETFETMTKTPPDFK